MFWGLAALTMSMSASPDALITVLFSSSTVRLISPCFFAGTGKEIILSSHKLSLCIGWGECFHHISDAYCLWWKDLRYYHQKRLKSKVCIWLCNATVTHTLFSCQAVNQWATAKDIMLSWWDGIQDSFVRFLAWELSDLFEQSGNNMCCQQHFNEASNIKCQYSLLPSSELLKI